MTRDTIALAHDYAVKALAAMQSSLADADAVEALILLPLIERAAALRNDLAALRQAMREVVG
jgi:hypothetical protein